MRIWKLRVQSKELKIQSRRPHCMAGDWLLWPISAGFARVKRSQRSAAGPQHKKGFTTETQRPRRKMHSPGRELRLLKLVDLQFLSSSVLRDLCVSVVNPVFRGARRVEILSAPTTKAAHPRDHGNVDASTSNAGTVRQ